VWRFQGGDSFFSQLGPGFDGIGFVVIFFVAVSSCRDIRKHPSIFSEIRRRKGQPTTTHPEQDLLMRLSCLLQLQNPARWSYACSPRRDSVPDTESDRRGHGEFRRIERGQETQ
jgi:hypothetical protein